MNLDHLLSRYLDGELTPEEDKQLRDLVASSPEARAEFDAAVSLFIHAREEAEHPSLSAAESSSIEDAIMMAALSSQASAVPVATAMTSLPSLSISLLSSLVVASLSLVPVSTGYRSGIVGGAESGSRPSVMTQPLLREAESSAALASSSVGVGDEKVVEKRFEAAAPVRPSRADISNAARYTAQVAEQDNADDLTIYELYVEESDDSSVEQSPDLAMASFNSAMTAPVRSEADPALRLSPAVIPVIPESAPVDFGFVGGSMFASFSGGAMESSDFIAQTISYKLDDRNRIGIEIGWMQFSYRHNSTMIRMAPSDAPSNRSVAMVITENPAIRPISSFFLSNAQRVSTDEALWGSLFYERGIPVNDLVEVSIRGGAGASNLGALGFARVGLTAHIHPSVALTAGVDGRSFLLWQGSVMSKQTSSVTNLSLSFGVAFHM